MLCVKRLIGVSALCLVMAASAAADELRLNDDVLDSVTAGLQTPSPIFQTDLTSSFNTIVGLPPGPITGPAPIVIPDPGPTPTLPGTAGGLLAAILAAIGITI